MSRYLIISPIDVNDMLADWSKYCRSHNMILGVVATNQTHAFTVHSNGQKCSINIENPDGDSADHTLSIYLNDFCRRNPHATITETDNEKKLIEESLKEDSIGIVTE